MRELLALTKVHLDSTFGISNMMYKIFKQKKDIWKPVLFIIVIASLIPVYLLYLLLIKSLYHGLQIVNQTNFLITLGFNVISFIVLIFSIVYVMSIYYFSTDISILIPLPIKPKNVILSKFIGMVVTQYMFVLPALLPIMVIFGVNEGKGIIFFIYAIICVLLVPIVPLSISTIIVMLIMRVTNIKGKKDIIRTIAMFAMLALVLGFQLFFSNSINNIPIGEEEQYIATLLENNMGLVNTMGKSFPSNIVVTKALTLDGVLGLINLLFSILISLAFLYLTVLVGEKVYLGGIIGGQERTSGSKKLSSDTLNNKLNKKSHPSISVFKLDISLLFRTPAYIVNCVSTVIIIPILIIAMPLISGDIGMADISKYYNEFYKYINIGLIALFVFIGATNPTASTTFSREGKNFWISRLVPVKAIDQIKGRMLTSIVLQLMGIIFIIIGMSFVVKLRVATIIISIIFGVLVAMPIFAIGILIDLVRPILTWDNPQKAVKQNLNVVISMLIGIVYVGTLGVLSVVLLNAFNSFMLIYGIVALVSVIITSTIVLIMNNILAERFVNIE